MLGTRTRTEDHGKARRRAAAVACAAAGVLLGVMLAGAGTAMAAFSPGVGIVKGEAYGSRAVLTSPILPDATLGRTARQTMPCFVSNDLTVNEHLNKSKLVGGVGVPVLVQTGTVDDTGTVDIEPSSTDVLETSEIQSVDLLAGMITADVIRARAHATLDPDHPTLPNLHRDAGDLVPTGASFVNLVIAGEEIDGTPPPNTKIALPGGIGTVYLNEIATEQGGRAVRNIAIHVKLKDLGGYSGEIIVALARAGVQAAAAGLQAEAYELRARTGDITSIGRQNYLRLPCFGTGETERHKSQSSAHVNGNLLPVTSSTLLSTVDGVLAEDASATRAIAKINNLNLADQVEAGLIQSQANAQEGLLPGDIMGAFANDTGTQFVSLTVGDQTFSGSPPPGTVIEVPGLGSVELNRQICTADGAQFRPSAVRPCQSASGAKLLVTGVLVQILDPGSGFPLGTEIRIAEALAAIRR